MKRGLSIFIFCLVLAGFLLLAMRSAELGASPEKIQQASDHFNGKQYFNPVNTAPPDPLAGQGSRGVSYRWIWRWVLSGDWPESPAVKNYSPGPSPETRIRKGTLRMTPVGHSTFLIQMDGVNILIDPIWSDRCSPVSWAGPKRHQAPGIRFEDLPDIDAILVSHNHYDHLDLPTLKRLGEKGTPRAIVTLGNIDLVRDTGIPAVDGLDWWQSVRLLDDVKVTLVPAQHFSSRTPWDRNKTLWGGFVVSGPSGRVFYSGDTGYGSHFHEIARRFSPITIAILPISPFRPPQSKEPLQERYPSVHMGPAEAIQAHMDLGAQLSIAAHFQVFKLGLDGFYDAVNELAATLKKRNLSPGVFIAPIPGQAISALTKTYDKAPLTVGKMNRMIPSY